MKVASIHINSKLKKHFLVLSVVLVNSLHVIFFNNKEMYDVYLFYEHPRHLTNILLDIGCIYAANVFTYLLMQKERSMYLPVFYTTLLIWPFYFTVYRQGASLFLIPFYLCTVILTQLKRTP